MEVGNIPGGLSTRADPALSPTVGLFEDPPVSLWEWLTHPLLSHPPQTLAGDAFGELVPPRATLTGVPSSALGAGPSDARDTDGFIQGSHLLLELKQSERRGKQ